MKIRGIIFAVVLAGCSGTMQGVVRGTGEPVSFTYEQGMDSDTYTAVVGSEVFKGRAVMDGAGATFGNAWNSDSFASFFGTTTTNRIVAVLLGNKGNSLNCMMRYADSSGFTTSGGVGVCKHSDGRIIDVVW